MLLWKLFYTLKLYGSTIFELVLLVIDKGMMVV